MAKTDCVAHKTSTHTYTEEERNFMLEESDWKRLFLSGKGMRRPAHVDEDETKGMFYI